MNKKLLVVLVIVTAILVTGAWVMAAKRSPTGTEGIKPAPENIKGVEQPAMAPGLPKHASQQRATSIPKPAAIQKKAPVVETTGHPQKGAISSTSVSGTPVRLGAPSGKDLCNLAGVPAYLINNWFYGLEWYANYQDPAVHGCTTVWPFKVSEIDFQMNFPPEWVEANVSLQGFIFANMGTPSCPEPGYYPGDVICSTLVYSYDIPGGGGYFEFPIPMTDSCCVYQPYFAAVYIWTDLYGLGVDAVSEDNPTATCRSYNDYGYGWEDLVAVDLWPGPIMLYSQGYTHPQNTCPAPPDTCYVSSVDPATQTVLAGASASYTAYVNFSGYVTSCNLTVTPDPACPSCVTTVTPNPVVLPATSATVTIQTDPTTPGGTYTFSVNGAKASATLIVVAPDDSCLAARYIAGSGYRFDGWSAGDQNAVLLDPAAMCISCGTNVYPWQIKQISSRWVNPSGATALDVIFHFYEATTPYCNGPGAEFYQFPATITAWSPTVVTVPVPAVVCVDGPFWLAVEYVAVTPPAIVFPSCRMSAQTYADTCTQFNYYGGAWIEWADFWAPPPPGYLWLAAIGNCEGNCPVVCDMAQDNGNIAGYASWIMEGFQAAKYYNPEDYCEPPVYPYKISDVEFPLYKWSTAAPEANIQIAIYLECQDSCNGPGTLIYLSDIYNITSFYPNWTHIDLPEPVCVYEPFFVALKWAAGPTPMPSMLMDNNYGLPGDSCHQWYFYPGYSPPWIEHHDLWGSPEAVGVTMLRVSGATNHFECQHAPCDTAVDSLAYHLDAAYIWSLPSTSGRNYPNERFNMPIDHGGRLERVRFAHYAMTGDPNPCYYVWLSDGMGHPADNNPPYQAIGTFCIPSASVHLYPLWTVIETYPQGIKLDPGEEFYVGYSFTFDPGDALNLLGDDYDVSTSTRAGVYWPTGVGKTKYEQYGLYMDFLIEAIICAEAPAESTFTVQCSPASANATPGDPAAVKYQVDVGAILGYNLPVTLSCAPPAGINVSFAPNPVIPPATSDVSISVDPGTPYGNYTLTFCGTGSDGQGPFCCDVWLTVQPPYDEANVPFYHGSQKATNFGAVGNDAANNNFLWYGLTSQLFDGTFIVATTDADHMALDVYNCEHVGWLPTEHLKVYYDAMYNANIAYGHFFTPEDVISCEYDSLFIVGIMETCVDFSIKIKVYYNPTTTPIVHMYPALYEDWDVGDAYNDWVDMDPAHNLMWQFDPLDPNLVFGMMKAPFYDDPMYNMVAVRNPVYVWPNAGFCDNAGGFYGLDSLYALVSRPGITPATEPDTDFSMMMTAPPIDLPPGAKHIEVWIDFGRDIATDGLSWSQWWHRVLRYAGFYRGDVNASDTLELPSLDVSDLVYLINYLLNGGTIPKPYADQGDVNADGIVNVADIVYLMNYVFKGGPPPVDYLRFIPQKWTRTSLFENPTWR